MRPGSAFSTHRHRRKTGFSGENVPYGTAVLALQPPASAYIGLNPNVIKFRGKLSVYKGVIDVELP